MTALQAREMTENTLKFLGMEKYLDHIYKEIEKAAIKGQRYIHYTYFFTSPSSCMRIAIREHLVKEGYAATPLSCGVIDGNYHTVTEHISW